MVAGDRAVRRPIGARGNGGSQRTVWIGVTALTALALAVRLVAVNDSLFGDELYSFDDTRADFGGIFDGLDRNEVNPPLFYILAWLAAQLGEAPALIRAPSVIAGTALVPVTFVLGRQAISALAGLMGAALVALSPFAVFYATEARAYALLAALVAVSTLALLRALDSGGWGWWITFVVATSAALYSHYTAIFVIGTQALWALLSHRQRIRELVLAHLAVALIYLPWLPSMLDQQSDKAKVAIIGDSTSENVSTALEFWARATVGHPYPGLDEIPGTVPLVLLGLAALLTAGGLVFLFATRQAPSARLQSPCTLILLLAAATPVGLLLYSVGGGADLYIPRNLSASIPALALVLGWALVSIDARVSKLAIALAVTGLGIGVAASLTREHRRPDARGVAQYLESESRATDEVVSLTKPDNLLLPIGIYLERPRDIFLASIEDHAAWRKAARGGRVQLVVPQSNTFRGLARFAGPDGLAVRRAQRFFPGLLSVGVGTYSGELKGRLTESDDPRIVLKPGGTIPIVDRAGGRIEALEGDSERLVVRGWAGDIASVAAATEVVAFSDGKLLVTQGPILPRPDLERGFGDELSRAGFSLQLRGSPRTQVATLRRLKLFALVDGKALPLNYTRDGDAARKNLTER